MTYQFINHFIYISVIRQNGGDDDILGIPSSNIRCTILRISGK